VAQEGVHLTLKFLGEVASEREDELAAALARAAGDAATDGARPLTLVVRGFGAFPAARRPRVVWAGIEPEPALELLQHRVEREMGPLGFPTEARPFRPHLTLGRATRDAGPREFGDAEAAFGAIGFEGVALVETVDLMQSTLHPRGAVYQVRRRERLS
jgi:2'-5' RNA ligase